MKEQMVENEFKYSYQKTMLKKYNANLISCNLRLPREFRYFPEFYALQDILEELFKSHLNVYNVKKISSFDFGWFLFSTQGDLQKLKKELVSLEENSEEGTFFDFDLISNSSEVISRRKLKLPARKCIVCGEEAKVCIRLNRHSREEVIQKFYESLDNFFLGQPKSRLATRIAECCISAALLEVSAYPSPGLVSPFDQGSHQDMDFGTFVISTAALTEVFSSIFAAAENIKNSDELFRRIRAIGSSGERKMFNVTKGINTQKGLIFILGIIIAALGAVGLNSSYNEQAEYIRKMCQGLVKKELKLKQDNKFATNGENAYLAYKITGVRGEAEKGFPLVFQVGIPVIKKGLAQGLSFNDAAIEGLLNIMQALDDTTLIKRGGIEGLILAKETSRDILNNGGMYTEIGRVKVQEAHKKFCTLGLSAGGAADLLAAALFYILLENKYQMLFYKK